MMEKTQERISGFQSQALAKTFKVKLFLHLKKVIG